jgi:hypothetical protein
MRFPIGSTIVNVHCPLQLCEVLSWHSREDTYYLNILTDTGGNTYIDNDKDLPIDIAEENWIICTELTKALI